MKPESRNSPLLGNASLSAYPSQRAVAAEFTLQRGIDHCWATVSGNTHYLDNASLSTLIAAGLIRVPVTTDTQITTNERFKAVFCFRSAPSYNREFIRQFSQEAVQIRTDSREVSV
jgi:hypothetical protein